MSNPAENVSNLVAGFVAKLRAVPGLVALLGGDETRIYSFEGASLQHAIETQLSPSVMVAWRGTVRDARGNFSTYRHDISVFIRTNTDADWPVICGYVTRGTAAGETVPIDLLEIDPSCDPMDDLPEAVRQADSSGIDFFEISMSFREK